MREISYADFDLLVQRAADGFTARVVNSPSGESPLVRFAAPFGELELENFLLKIGRPRRVGVRGGGSPEAAAIREFGTRLFDAVFGRELRDSLVSSLDQVEARGIGLRLRLRLSDCPELVDLPWECLYDETHRRFLSLSEWTPLVRYLDLPGRGRPLQVRPPLRVLVLIASPGDYAPLNADGADGEWDKLRNALSYLRAGGRLHVDRVDAGNLDALQRQLRRADYHVFHYVGHGGFDAANGDGLLVLEGSDRRGQLVSGQDLGALLHDHRTLRLAVLNSCEGARSGVTDPYAGTAQSLVQQGIPAVVAMQFEITDGAAVRFSQAFYEAVADNYPVDAAMAAARKALRNSPNPVEWVTPVLYLRAPDGRLFDLDTTGLETGDQKAMAAGGRAQQVADQDAAAGGDAAADPLYVDGLAAFFAERWDEAITRLKALLARYPDDVLVRDRLANAYREGALANWSAEADAATERQDWPQAVEALTQVLAVDSANREAAVRLEHARTAQRRQTLLEEISSSYRARQWQAVIAAGDELHRIDPNYPDPDGLVSQARDALAEQLLADRYQTAQRQLADRARSDAIETLSAIEQECPGYRDVAALLAEAQRSVPHLSATAPSTHVPESRILQVGQWVGAVAFSPDGSRLATGSRQRVRVWDLRTGSVAWEQPIGSWAQCVTSVAFSPDGSRLATGSDDRTARIWLLPSPTASVGKLQHQFTQPVPLKGRVWNSLALDGWSLSVVFSSDGSRLATGSDDQTARIWDATTGKEQLRVVHTGRVNSVAFSPDGSRIATGSSDKTARIWDATTGKEQLRAVHTGRVISVAFSPDGSRLATGSEDHTAGIWDATTGTQLLAVAHTAIIRAVAFSPYGSRLATGSEDNTARIWSWA